MKKSAKIPLTSPLFFLLTLIIIIIIIIIPVHSNNTHIDPSPTLWPEKFHALLYMNLTDGKLQITDLWYDWPKGRNLNLMQKQLGDLLHDVEWNNGTSYYYTEGPTPICRTMEFEVGIPRPNWLAGSTYLGTRYTDGFLCHVWEKVDFIWYYEDVNTRQPVRWDFYDGISTHVITYEIGASLEDSKWQAPPYCFNSNNNGTAAVDVTDGERKIRNGKDQRNIGGLTSHSLRKLVNE